MARRVVVEISCSRCTRTEHRQEPATPPGQTPPPTFLARMGDLKVEFEDLCGPCLNAVKNHLEAIGKKIEGVSPERERKPKEDEPKSEQPVAKKKSQALNA